MQNITIVGGGLVGSLLATYLGQQKYPVTVYEKRPDVRTEEVDGGRSINLALSHRGWKALEEVGLVEQVEEIAIPMFGRQIHHLDGSQSFQPYGKEEQAIYSVSRGELNKILVEKAASFPNVQFHFGQTCLATNVQTNTLSFQSSKKETQQVTSDLILGADGAYSKVRQALQKTTRFNYAQHYLKHGYKELSIPPTKEKGWRLKKNALHIWPRKSFMLIALPNLDGSFTCTLFLAYEGAISFENLQTPEQVQAFFQQYFPDALPVMPNLLTDFFTNPIGSLITIRCSPWTYQDKVALIGDASHAIVPFYGQGMNAGFEDCRIFHTLLAKHTNNQQTNWQQVFKDFENERIPNAEAIADLALRNFIEMRDLVGNKQFLLRKKIEKYLAQRFPTQFTPLYSLVTFSSVPYANALAIGQKQDELLAQIMRLPNLATEWDTGGLDAVFEGILTS